MNKIRPGRIGEASLIGVSLVVLGVIFGQRFDDSAYRGCLVFSNEQLGDDPAGLCGDCVDLAGVGAAVPARLSQFLHEGRRDRACLGVGILVAQPTLKMPAPTPFVHGGGPISGTVWPFVCIVIACGALSGFHALISSGTTPKMINKEIGHPPDRLRRDADGGFRVADGPDRRLLAGARRLFQDQHREGPVRATRDRRESGASVGLAARASSTS